MALTLPRISLRAALLAPAMLALAACGSGVQEDPLLTAGRAITAGLFSGGQDAAPAGGAQINAATIPPELLQQFSGPLMLVETLRLDGAAIYTRIARNGSNQTWEGAENISVTVTDAYVLRSTRGFGFDLMASDVRPVEAALRARRTGDVQRLMVHLDGDLVEERRVHACSLRIDGRDQITVVGRSRAVTRATETCRFDDQQYENIFWLDAQGRALQSVQWAGERIGHIRLTVLRD